MFRSTVCFLSLLLFLLLTIKQSQSQKIKCNASTEKEMDETVRRIMTFGTDRLFPVSKPDFKEYCKEQTKLIAKLENYKTVCLKNQAKSIVSVIIYSIKQVFNIYCKHPNSKRTAELLDSATCANSASKDYDSCSIEYIERLIYSKSLKTSKERLIQACCGYFAIFNCVRAQGEKHPDNCSQERINANIGFVRAFFDNAINAACGEYSGDSDKCEKVKIPNPKKSKKPLPKSFFNPLVKLLSNL